LERLLGCSVAEKAADPKRKRILQLGGCTEQRKSWDGTHRDGNEKIQLPCYACQDQLPYFTSEYIPGTFARTLRLSQREKVGLWRLIKGSLIQSYYRLSMAGIAFGTHDEVVLRHNSTRCGEERPGQEKRVAIALGKRTPKLDAP